MKLRNTAAGSHRIIAFDLSDDRGSVKIVGKAGSDQAYHTLRIVSMERYEDVLVGGTINLLPGHIRHRSNQVLTLLVEVIQLLRKQAGSTRIG